MTGAQAFWLAMVGGYVASVAYTLGWWWRGRCERKRDKPAPLKEETRKWVRDNLAAARRAMTVSTERGDLRANFAAHEAHRALKDLERTL
jgi:hypothetical protein